MIQLLGHWASPFATRVRLALRLKGLSYEFVQEDKIGEKSELLLASNPVYKRAPVLIHNGEAICESMIIVQYIDEAWASSGPPILPPDPYDRAVVRFWTEFLDGKAARPIQVILGLNDGDKEEAFGEILAMLQQMETVFEECAKGKPFFGGEAVGYLDIALGCFLGWYRVLEEMYGLAVFDRSLTPKIVQWSERFCAESSVREVMPDTDVLVEQAKQIQAFYSVVKF